jgi:hypothetical protein
MGQAAMPAVMGASYGGGYGMAAGPQASVLEQAAIAEVMVAARLAQLRPRNMLEARQRLLQACRSPVFAEAAIYRKPMGGGDTRGLSIRFVEEATRCLGNIKFQAMQILDDAEQRVMKVTGWDMETGLSYSQDVTIQKRIERHNASGRARVYGERQNADGKTIFIVGATDDEVRMLESRELSFGYRNIGLRFVPEDLQTEAWAACEATMADKVKQDPQAEMHRVCDGFAKLNVMPRQLEAYLGHELATATPAEIVKLRQVFKALEAGESTWPAVLETAQQEREASAVRRAREAERTTGNLQGRQQGGDQGSKAAPKKSGPLRAGKATEKPEPKAPEQRAPAAKLKAWGAAEKRWPGELPERHEELAEKVAAALYADPATCGDEEWTEVAHVIEQATPEEMLELAGVQ